MNYVTDSSTPAPDRLNMKNRLLSRDFSLGDILRLLWRRRGLILGIIVLAAALTIAALLSIKPTYTAGTEVLIDTQETRIADIEDVLTDSTPDDEALMSEIEIIRSRSLAEKVVDDFQLTRDPEFNSALRPLTPVQSAIKSVRSAITSMLPEDLVASPDDMADEGTDERTAELNETVQAFLDQLTVGIVGRSRVISIRFSSEDPQKAAQLANAVADAYLLSQLDAKYEATRRANQWLSTKLDDLRQKVNESESAVEAYRQREGLLQSGAAGGTLISQQVTDLNSELIVARADRTAAEARLQQVRQAVRSAGGAEAIADVLGSQVIIDLRNQETDVKRKIADFADQLGDRHPRMISARSELADVQDKIRQEVSKVIRKLEGEAAISRARESSLQNSLNQLQTRLARANTSTVQLRALEREAEANKTTLESFLGRFEELSAQSDLSAHDINARILSRATVPLIPSAPKKTLILAVVLVAATALAILLAFALENLDSGFRSGDQVEEATGVRTLGLIPVLSGYKKGGPEKYIVENPSSMFGEAVRSVYTSVLISYSRPAPRTVMITSSQPKEGKSTLAVCLARMCAISGKKTVLVEGDLRKPAVHKLTETTNSPGMVEYFRGEADLDAILQKDSATGAYVIPAGKLVVDPVKVLSSPQVRQLFTALSQQFDLVVIDTPPLMAVADARLIAPDIDATVFVVRWGRTNREVVRLGLKTLLETGANLSGVVLSRVDAKRHAQYGFGDSGYYYKGVQSYYTKKA
ncbi:MAG: polysaccharide biosynthesis tyrosine autokinase [Rhodospirillales bacterium]|nr:polysaccharide biosynthesis tyrosine autokinase [Rhodospirillales bacterium]